MSFLKPDVKTSASNTAASNTAASNTVSDPMSQLFKEVEKEQEWDQLFIDYNKAPMNTKPAPLEVLYLTVYMNLGKSIAIAMLQQIDKCLMYALNQQLTAQEQNMLLNILKTDVLSVKPELKDRKDLTIEWDTINQQYTETIENPIFSDRVIDIITRYQSKLAMAITSLLERCIKKNFLQKLPLEQQQLILFRFDRIIKSIIADHQNEQAIRKKYTLFSRWALIMNQRNETLVDVSKYQEGYSIKITRTAPKAKSTKKWFDNNIHIISDNEQGLISAIEDILIRANANYQTKMLLLQAVDNAKEYFAQKAAMKQ